MSNAILTQAVSLVPAQSVDLLMSDASVLGIATGFDVEVCGTGLAATFDIPVIGTNDSLGLVAQTGAAHDGTALLAGSPGLDTLSESAPVSATSDNVLIPSVAKSGADTLVHSDAMLSTALPYEMSVALMLHRIDIVVARVAVPLAVETGCAL